MKLTIAKIAAVKIPPGKTEIKLWNDAVKGHYLRCRASGSKLWYYRYRPDGGGRSVPQKSVKIGDYPALSIDAATNIAKIFAGQVAKGNDPAQERSEKRRKEKATVGSLLAVDGPYERDLTARHMVKKREVLSVLRRGLTRFANADIATITRRELVEAMDALKDLPGARAELRKNTRGLLEWCVNNGLVHANVLAGLRMAPKTRQQSMDDAAKRRALADSDIAAVWNAAGRAGRFGSLVQLALLTGMRKNELATLRWSDVLHDRIVLRAATTKTGTAHEVPLTGLMRQILERQPRTTSPLIFASDRTGGPMASWNKMKMALMREADVGAWTLHDLRRSCRTLMSRIGIAEPIAEAAIGHVKATLVGLYNMDEQWSARFDAFQRVSDHVDALVGNRVNAKVRLIKR